MALASTPNVRCYLGDSAQVLPEILRQLRSPAMFWLDAHWCGEGTGFSQTECPLLRELELILNHHRDHIIMIDDARCFLAPPPPPHRANDWPSFADICNFLLTYRPFPIVQLLGDVIYIGPRGTAPAVTECSRQIAKSDAAFEVVYPWF
jgi:hypothetical protein